MLRKHKPFIKKYRKYMLNNKNVIRRYATFITENLKQLYIPTA
jgi:hypothetical protein